MHPSDVMHCTELVGMKVVKKRGCETSEHYEGGGFLLTVFEISTSGFLQSSSFVVNFIILKAS